ncbi:hypothetical protein evm_003211 [Chilo suppressalis]|nr:hypothetical protein evm_003211 [Chilo suppressalis]
MKLLVIAIFLIVGASTASVLRDERAVSTEEEHGNTPTPSSSSTAKAICAPHTPCAWSMYKPVIKFIEINVTNSYCECDKGLECIINEDDVSVSAYVYRCRSPVKEDSTTIATTS